MSLTHTLLKTNLFFRVQKSFQSYGGFCKSVLYNHQLVLPQDKSSLDAIDVDTFETVRKFVPDETENVGSTMCLETFTIRGTEYLLVGYESGRHKSLHKLQLNKIKFNVYLFSRSPNTL